LLLSLHGTARHTNGDAITCLDQCAPTGSVTCTYIHIYSIEERQ